jgi:uncharacterized protein DUF1569
MGSGRVAAIDGEHFDELMAELDASVREVLAAVDREPVLWNRSLPGKWTAGQHLSHLAITVNATVTPFEERLPLLRRGELPPHPRRGMLQSMWVFMVVRRGKLPRGGRTPRPFEAGPSPNRDATLGALRNGVERHRAIGSSLTLDERDRLWVPNPFHPRWHYTLPEMVRVHAVHVRHHTKLIAEIPTTVPAP